MSDFISKQGHVFCKSVENLRPGVHYVEGVVYEPDTLDDDGEFMRADDIYEAQKTFFKNGSQIDRNHDFKTKDCPLKIATSYIAKSGDIDGYKPGSWVLGAEIDTLTKAGADMWDEIQSGRYRGWSLAAYAQVVEETL